MSLIEKQRNGLKQNYHFGPNLLGCLVDSFVPEKLVKRESYCRPCSAKLVMKPEMFVVHNFRGSVLELRNKGTSPGNTVTKAAVQPISPF